MKILKASKERTKEDRSALRKTVGDIIENVIENGDAALLEYNHRFDGCDRASLRISKEEIEAAYKEVPEEDIEDIKKAMTRFTDKQVDVNIAEIKQADMDATLVAENIAGQLERRIGFRRAMKQAVGRTMRLGAKGIKIMVSGRLGGAEIARSESYREGSIPLHTLRADIDYGTAEAHTTYGCIGIKVWIYKGEVLPEAKQAPAKKEEGGK